MIKTAHKYYPIYLPLLQLPFLDWQEIDVLYFQGMYVKSAYFLWS